jgi:hypothetical protein
MEKKMENIYEIQSSSNIQNGIALEEKASSLIQGGLGGGSESRFAYRWPQ